MKKVVLCVLAVLFAGTSVFAGAFSFQGSIGTGNVFYGDSSITQQNADLTAQKYSHLMMTGDAALVFSLAKQAELLAGGEGSADFYWYGDKYCRYLDYAVFCGFRVYPGLAGLVLGVDYDLGCRTTFCSADTASNTGDTPSTESCGWGNGFKFSLEYDFSQGTGSFAPVLGAGWRRMPRGTSADNLISVYFRMALR